MNRIDLSGRTAVVTGGAKGIGYASAERLLESGAAVSLWDIDAARLTEAARNLADKGADKDKVHSHCVDVSYPGAVTEATAATLAHFASVDILIANAGIAGIMKQAWEYSLAEWDRLIGIDLTSVFLSCRALVPQMVARGYGRIVVVSSIAGMEGAAHNAAYSAAKAGAIGFTKALGKELAQSGVLANCVTPSGIETDLLAEVTPEYRQAVLARMPIGRFGHAEEAAALIAWLASEDCSFNTGAVFDLSGGRAVY